MKTILIIDDEPDFADMIGMRLEASGYAIIKAESGEDGLKTAAQENPNLILLDVMMPGMDGFEVLKQLKRNPSTEGIRVIMLTARSESKAIFRGQDLGADDYLFKPCDSQELLDTCRKYARY